MKIILIFISFLLVIFLANSSVGAEMSAGDKSDLCPQNRKTITAPRAYLEKKNPLRKEFRHIKKRKRIISYQSKTHCLQTMPWNGGQRTRRNVS
jgi:hypothetical protein